MVIGEILQVEITFADQIVHENLICGSKILRITFCCCWVVTKWIIVRGGVMGLDLNGFWMTLSHRVQTNLQGLQEGVRRENMTS